MGAYYSIQNGIVDIYGSGDLSFLMNQNVRAFRIERNESTAADDPVVVDLSSILPTCPPGVSVEVWGGAKVIIGGGFPAGQQKSVLRINGGQVELKGGTGLADGQADIVVGPNGGRLIVDSFQGASTPLRASVTFLDNHQNTTETIPPGFVIDYPNTLPIPAKYIPSQNITLLGSDVRVVDQSERTLIMKGDPFHLQLIGVAIGHTGLLSIVSFLRKWGVPGRINGLKPQDLSRVDYYRYDFVDSDGYGGVIACYLSGSEVRVPGGRVRVEELREGMEVLVRDLTRGVERCERVSWVGQGTAHARPAMSADMAGWPVKILRHALGENIPYKDMRVTSEHCIFLNGVFVPVRMLVNGGSIFYDMTEGHYQYWHFETAQHAVIDVDGVWTETFLNTGHEPYFAEGDIAADTPSSPIKSWEKDAAAALETRREVIEPLYRQLSQRAQALGLHMAEPLEGELTDDPALGLCDEQGRLLPLKERQGQHYIFSLKDDVKRMMLLSRTSRPCDVVGPYLDDRRKLGVLVGEVRLFWEDGRSYQITSFLTAPRYEGWDVQEQGPWRWMNGRAFLELPKGGTAGAFLSIEVKAGGPYLRVSSSTEEEGSAPDMYP